MSTQYLTLVNSVLRRLREDEVSAVANTTYSKMVGDFVNDAKRQVENSHDCLAVLMGKSVLHLGGDNN